MVVSISGMKMETYFGAIRLKSVAISMMALEMPPSMAKHRSSRDMTMYFAGAHTCIHFTLKTT